MNSLGIFEWVKKFFFNPFGISVKPPLSLTPSPITQLWSVTPAAPWFRSFYVKNETGIYILAILEDFFVQIEKQGRIWRRTWKRKGKGGKEEKKEKVIKTHFKTPLWSLNTAKNPQKQGRILEGAEFFWLAKIYTPLF